MRLLSYQDTEVHKGTIYAAAGWKAVRTSEFVSWDKHTKRPGKINQSFAPKVRWEYTLRETINTPPCATATNEAKSEDACQPEGLGL
jgi:hypothetical protein